MSGNLGSTDLKRLHREWRRRTEAGLGLILDDVETPFNVGSLCRTAAAYRVDHLWIAGRTASPRHPKAAKTSMGSERFVEWSTTETVADAITDAKAAGFTVVGVELADGARPLHQLTLSNKVCLVVGNEQRGLGADALQMCDALGFIPQLGKIGSLNVALAAGIAIYEVRRQEWAPEPN